MSRHSGNVRTGVYVIFEVICSARLSEPVPSLPRSVVRGGAGAETGERRRASTLAGGGTLRLLSSFRHLFVHCTTVSLSDGVLVSLCSKVQASSLLDGASVTQLSKVQVRMVVKCG